jgi:hypothetical protein
MEQHFKISDSVGVPSTIGAVLLNIMKIMNITNINMALTLIISMLSIAYLGMNIYIKAKEIKKLKNESNA